ncbi:MAG: tetratricopeptide repeat protein [Euryarchaeota archaeon]|nr:tetratricopeptide repeat protein [Euryarchaeota archaeon]
MKCVLCGRESTKPVCKVCTREIAIDTPFLTRWGFATGNFDNESVEDPVIFKKHMEKANASARRALAGENEDFISLAKLALRLHREHGDYLSIFDIEENYYLRLAEEFATRDTTSEGKFLLSIIYEEEDNLDAALSTMEEIWKERDSYAIHYGELLVKSGKWGRAIEVYNGILKDNPEDFKVWELLADALMEAEQYEEAERAYLRVLQLDKNNAEVWFKRGVCLRKMGKWGGALQSFQTAVRKNPKHREAYENIVDILLERNMFSRARETLKKMLAEGFDVEDKLKEVEGLM